MTDPRKTVIQNLETGEIYQSIKETMCRLKLKRSTLYNLLRKKDKLIRYDPDLPNEIWQNHPTLNVLVSNLGRVHGTYGKTFGHLYNGYMVIGIGTKPYRTYRVHRLVAQTWLTPPESDDLHVDHLDGNPTNNDQQNLEWVTPGENNRRRHSKQK